MQLEFGIPIGNGILTTDTDEQALTRAETKGFEAAQAALELANLLDAIDEELSPPPAAPASSSLQGLYQRQLSGNAPEAIRAQLAEASGFAKADDDYFDELWTGVSAEYDELVALCRPASRPARRRSSRRSSARSS